jgi:hypothetical protein
MGQDRIQVTVFHLYLTGAGAAIVFQVLTYGNGVSIAYLLLNVRN